jgi:hypothetical protein
VHIGHTPVNSQTRAVAVLDTAHFHEVKSGAALDILADNRTFLDQAETARLSNAKAAADTWSTDT